MRRIDELAGDLLREQIEEHEQGKCNCDLTDEGYGLCYAGQWLEGCITSEQVVSDLGN